MNKRIYFSEKEKEDEIKALNKSYEQHVSELHTIFKQRMDKIEHVHQKSISDLEQELVKQRERTLKLLDEKEIELDQFKCANGGAVNLFQISPKKKDTNSSGSLITNEPDAIDEGQNNVLPSPQTETKRIIHYSQETAYKEGELNKLRAHKAELEYRLKQTNDEHSVDIDRFQTQIGVLKQEIERIKLNQSRNELNSPNQEYLKNVIFNFMTTKDSNVRLNMQNALMQILQFTKHEKQKLISLNGSINLTFIWNIVFILFIYIYLFYFKEILIKIVK